MRPVNCYRYGNAPCLGEESGTLIEEAKKKKNRETIKSLVRYT